MDKKEIARLRGKRKPPASSPAVEIRPHVVAGSKSHNRSSVLSSFAFAVATAMCCFVSLAYGASIRERINKDPKMCAAFSRMVRAASIEKKSDDELCVFRFSTLPKDIKGKFTFPDWKEFTTDDVAEEASRIHDANIRATTPAQELLRKNYISATRSAVAENNLALYRVELPLEAGENPLYVEMMDVRSCSGTTFPQSEVSGEITQTPYMSYDAYPSFSMYLDSAFSKSIPVKPEPRGQLAIWDGSKTVQLSIPSKWIRISRDPSLTVGLLALTRMPASMTVYGHVDADIQSYEVCEIDIDK